MWGWSHTPYLGGVIEGNILEDAEQGGILGVEHDGRYIKSNQGRIYMTAKLNDNVVRWSDAFLSHHSRAGAQVAARDHAGIRAVARCRRADRDGPRQPARSARGEQGGDPAL